MLIAIAIAEEIQGLQMIALVTSLRFEILSFWVGGPEGAWGDLQRIWVLVGHLAQRGPLLGWGSATNKILCNPWISSAMAMAMSIYRTLVFVFFFSFLIAHLGECFFVFFLSFSFLIFFLAIWWSGDQKVLLVSIRRQTHHLPWPDHNRTAKIMIVRKKLKRNTQRNTPLSIMGIRPWKLWR